ncbi:MAG: hypothetical protein CMN31_21940 [Sandaracinus sp.]|nr:hypothetical protein [Sandaracinus sp.]MBJ73953.1 hypothetical protein [Sandaracinus sp.]
MDAGPPPPDGGTEPGEDAGTGPGEDAGTSGPDWSAWEIVQLADTEGRFGRTLLGGLDEDGRIQFYEQMPRCDEGPQSTWSPELPDLCEEDPDSFLCERCEVSTEPGWERVFIIDETDRRACALHGDGRVACWLIDEEFGEEGEAMDPPAGTAPATDLSCFGDFCCLLDAAGALDCWRTGSLEERYADDPDYVDFPEAVEGAFSGEALLDITFSEGALPPILCGVSAERVRCLHWERFAELDALVDQPVEADSPAAQIVSNILPVGGTNPRWTCVRFEDGATACYAHRLGSPEFAGFDEPVVKLDVGGLHILGLTDDGRVLAHGVGTDPEDADEDRSPSSDDVDQGVYPFESELIDVAAFSRGSCGITADRCLECWGEDRARWMLDRVARLRGVRSRDPGFSPEELALFECASDVQLCARWCPSEGNPEWDGP